MPQPSPEPVELDALVGAPLLAGAVAAPLLAGPVAALDDELDAGLVVLELDVACPGVLEQAAKTIADAATRAVSDTARVLVIKDPPEERIEIRQRGPH